MLSRLSIRNYAIIDRLEIDFSGRLNIITGETGAGKSIIIGALGLILGQRAESSVLLNKEQKCIVEGCFKVEAANETINGFLKLHELDVLDELMVRREIAVNGKSRAFINDTPVNLTQLNELTTMLVDLHQQFDTMELGERDFQREVLDALASNAALLSAYRTAFSESQSALKNLTSLQVKKEQFNKELDYHQFQFNELDEAGFKPDELEELEQQLKLASSAEEIKNALTRAYYDLDEGDEPLIKKVKAITAQLQNFSSIHPALPGLIERLHSVTIELQDIADETDHINNHISSDVAKLEEINERLGMGYRLLKKHGVKTTNELLAIYNELNERLQAVLNIDDEIENATRRYDALLMKTRELAGKISAARAQVIKPLEQQVNKMLVQVGMPNARLKVALTETSLNIHGSDAVEFLFDANKSNQFNPLRKVASGGELSRLMLCIKSLVARSMNMPTLIFDEIDTGISGEAAKQVGLIMKELAGSRQVMCITHQPQIAGKADAHYLVYKAVKNDAITTGVRMLDKDERIVAIAKMLSGEKPTAAAIENAREMVMN